MEFCKVKMKTEFGGKKYFIWPYMVYFFYHFNKMLNCMFHNFKLTRPAFLFLKLDLIIKTESRNITTVKKERKKKRKPEEFKWNKRNLNTNK